MLRIGLLTSGGDCQALNATMRGVVKGLANNVKDLEVYGFMNGYKGLIYSDYRMLSAKDFFRYINTGRNYSRNLTSAVQADAYPGCKRSGQSGSNEAYLPQAPSGLPCHSWRKTEPRKTANLLREEGLNIIHLPKTIDNDIYGTDMTFGFYSAVNIASDAIDCIHTTASSHQRVFIVEVMGHKVGWLTLYAGIASGADVILIPEIPYDIEKYARPSTDEKSAEADSPFLPLPRVQLQKKTQHFRRKS